VANYICPVCGYVHDESASGEPWAELPDDWTCPVCGAAKSQFEPDSPPPAQTDATIDAPAQATIPSANRAVVAHRVFGYVFLSIYLLLLVQMIPRLWTYQIEFPARTALHIALGMALGAALLVKIGVVRFFPRLTESLVPALGTSLLVGSVVVIGISVPSALREAAATTRLFAEENRDRVAQLLEQTGLEKSESLRWTRPDSLRAGQRILRQDCVECHDLRTVLARPRTPDNWRQTVRRMADRTTMLNSLDEQEQWQVTAYLVALSPQLQQSAQKLREAQQRRDQAEQAVADMAEADAYDASSARQLFESKCSQCHPTALVGESPPGSEDEARELVARMVEEGLEASEQELATIVRYLSEDRSVETE
jgi:rubredoxin/mono/diheme cytochrome c family protein